jgi:rhodanese-related sulfurtransferase
MERIVALNRGPFVGAPPATQELAAPPDGAQVLDVRPVEAFAEGHLPGALSVPVAGTRFATKAGFVIELDRAVVVAASDAPEAGDAVRGLRSIGILDIAGYVPGGGPEKLDLLAPDDLAAMLANGAEVVDVREAEELDTGTVAESRNIPYRLLGRSEVDLPRDRPIVTVCETGPRAAIAASILAARGFDARPVVNGGIDTWLAENEPAIELRRSGS